MTIEEAFRLCAAGRLTIQVNSMEEKQTLIDLCHDYGYETGGCTAVSYQKYPFLGNKNGEPTDTTDGKFSFWTRQWFSFTNGICKVTTLSELSTNRDIDSDFVSDLL